jgi:hypothetical protein
LHALRWHGGNSCYYFKIKSNNMKPNMGTADRIIRILLAAVFAYLYFSGTVTGILGLILVILGGVFVLTSLISFCPLYTLVGMNTCSKKKAG